MHDERIKNVRTSGLVREKINRYQPNLTNRHRKKIQLLNVDA